MTTVLSFLAAIALLVAVHEWGHYRMARACGVRVLRFSIGFGKVLLRHQATPDSTEWTLSAIPLGGYVRMLDTREGAVAGPLREQAFDQRPLWQRSLIVAAGPLANFVLACVLYAGASWLGVTEPAARLAAPTVGSPLSKAGLAAGDRVMAVCSSSSREGMGDPVCTEVQTLPELQWTLTRALMDGRSLSVEVSDGAGGGRRRLPLRLDADQNEVDEHLLRRLGLRGPYSAPVLAKVLPEGAADAAGLRAGDRVLSVDSVAVADAADLRDRIRAQAGQAGRPQQWLVQRGEERLVFDVQPRPAPGPDGRSIGRVEAQIGSPGETVLVRRGFLEGLWHGIEQSADMSWLTVRMLGKMLVGEASLKNLSGPLTIADAAGQSVQRGPAQYLTFLAVVSVSLFVLNLVPLPMLDGGHLMYHLFEAVTRRPPSELWMARFQKFGMVSLLSLMVLALANDVMRFLGPN